VADRLDRDGDADRDVLQWEGTCAARLLVSDVRWRATRSILGRTVVIEAMRMLVWNLECPSCSAALRLDGLPIACVEGAACVLGGERGGKDRAEPGAGVLALRAGSGLVGS
jgi:hypothetical protein